MSNNNTYKDMKILSIRAIHNGSYKFTSLIDKGFISNFTIAPKSCCPPFFTNEDLNISVDSNKLNKIPDIKNVVKELLDDKIIEWMNNMKYNPHDEDNGNTREKYNVVSSFFSPKQSYKSISSKKHKKNFNISKLDLTDFKIFN